MHSSLSTRSLLISLAALIAVACAYFLVSALSGGAGGGWRENTPPLTIEEKAAVLHSLSQASEPTVTPSEFAERLCTLESVAQSSNDSPASQQSDADKVKVLRTLNSQ